jgi:hypothetical protein
LVSGLRLECAGANEKGLKVSNYAESLRRLGKEIANRWKKKKSKA